MKRWGPAVAMMALIFLASAQPQDNGVIPDFGVMDFPVKKAAHLTVYAILAVCMRRGLLGESTLSRPNPQDPRPTTQDSGRLLSLAFCLTVLYAATDEYHQTFVAGRMGHAADVGIDAVGAIIGLAIRHAVGARRAGS